jgi:hypothetical protein
MTMYYPIHVVKQTDFQTTDVKEKYVLQSGNPTKEKNGRKIQKREEEFC